MLIDLQLHSTYSDGYLTPTELVKFMASMGVGVAALTDHNTVGGLNEFRLACRRAKIKPITGMELYVKLDNHKFNILWYNFDETNPELHNLLRGSQLRRRRLMRVALVKLQEAGFKLNIDKILDKHNHYQPLNHVVNNFLSVKFNYNKAKKELGLKNIYENDIINGYFRNKKIGRLQNSFISLDRILKLRKKIGGYIILCHPAKHNYINKNAWKKFKAHGVDGVEILSPHHSWGAAVEVQRLARELNFIETGGSDFHRFEGNNYLIQDSWQYYKINSIFLKKIKKIIG